MPLKFQETFSKWSYEGDLRTREQRDFQRERHSKKTTLIQCATIKTAILSWLEDDTCDMILDHNSWDENIWKRILGTNKHWKDERHNIISVVEDWLDDQNNNYRDRLQSFTGIGTASELGFEVKDIVDETGRAVEDVTQEFLEEEDLLRSLITLLPYPMEQGNSLKRKRDFE